jgi:hypothetical protein
MNKFILTVVIWLIAIASNAQVNQPRIGAYYFDGWKKLKGNPHLTSLLINEFSEREPKWGWVTSTQKNVDNQIIAASEAGLSFFSFCWYYNKKYPVDTSNRALSYFNKSKVNAKLEFCLMVANHEGYEIGPAEWPIVCDEWIKQFKSAKYLKVDGKPLIIFFSVGSLAKKFKTTENIKEAFKVLRERAIGQGLAGVTIAACVGNSKKEIRLATESTFDNITGYNYHGYGFLDRQKDVAKVPIAKMQLVEKGLWSTLSNMSELPYIPVSTLNWDPRPWKVVGSAKVVPYFSGFSSKSVYRSVTNCVEWMNLNVDKTTKEKIAILYAWNEYGEGAYLTPSKTGGNVLIGVKKALSKK